MATEFFVSNFNYWAVVILMMIGLYIVFASGNMVKRLVGLGVFQTSVFLFYISVAKVRGGIPPILPEKDHHHGDAHDDHGVSGYAATLEHGDGSTEDVTAGHDATTGGDVSAPVSPPDGGHFDAAALDVVYSNPLPHVLILTAIVVGVATLAVGLALVVRIREAYGTIEDEDVSRAEFEPVTSGEPAS